MDVLHGVEKSSLAKWVIFKRDLKDKQTSHTLKNNKRFSSGSYSLFSQDAMPDKMNDILS